VVKKVKSLPVRAGESADLAVFSLGVAEAVAGTGRTLTSEQMLGGLKARIEPIRPSAVYRLWVTLVAVVMVLLPLFYIGFGDTLVYPFEYVQDDITLARFIVPTLPDEHDIGALLQASEEALERLRAVYARSLGGVAVMVEDVERALGLPGIEFPAAENETT
jgi:hypothetical protein